MASQTLRSRSGKIMAVAGFAFAALGIIALAADSWQLALAKSWIYIWFGYSCWLVFWNPSVGLSERGVVVDNIFRKTLLNWPAIRRIDTKYSLTLETDGGAVRAFAAPAPSRYAGFMANKTEAEHLPESSFVGKGLVRPGDLTSSDSGVAAFLIRTHWEKLRDRGQLDGASEVQTSWILSRVLVLVALSGAAIVGFNL